MNLFNRIFPLVIAVGLGSTLIYGSEKDGQARFQQELEESDLQALLDFINSKRKIPIADKSKKLKISGDIHAEWNYYTEKIRGKNVRREIFREDSIVNSEILVPGNVLAIGHNDYDVQFDLYIDWDTERTWARSHLRFDNSAGVDDNGVDQEIDPGGYHGSGSARNLALKEAYVGYEIFKRGDQRLTIELGRRGNIYKAFYSEIEFASRLDGIILKYCNTWKNFAEYYFQVAGFVVDERATHHAFAIEVGLGDIRDTGIDIKYSYIDWTKWGFNRYFIRHPNGFQFKVSQVSMLWNTKPKFLCEQPLQLAGGFLINHTPSGWVFVNKSRDPAKYVRKRKFIGYHQNLGGFFAFQYREVHKEGDWFMKGLIGYCEAQCIPDNDVRNLGTGNFLNDSITSDGRGNTNWQGYGIKFGYAITDNLVVETQYDHTWSIDNHIAGSHGFTRYCLETVYSF